MKFGAILDLNLSDELKLLRGLSCHCLPLISIHKHKKCKVLVTT